MTPCSDAARYPEDQDMNFHGHEKLKSCKFCFHPQKYHLETDFKKQWKGASTALIINSNSTKMTYIKKYITKHLPTNTNKFCPKQFSIFA
jgi:hypothetical protein